MVLHNFEVSAPGKVILHGEHSVVYGKPAIAGVVQVRNKMQLKVCQGLYLFNFVINSEIFISQEIPDSDTISVSFSKLGLNFELNTKAVNAFITSITRELNSLNLPKDLNHVAFCDHINKFIGEQFQSKELSDRERNSIVSFVYLLVGIKIAKKDYETTAFEVSLETAMSIGAGLGSSASFGVCLAGAFVMLAR